MCIYQYIGGALFQHAIYKAIYKAVYITPIYSPLYSAHIYNPVRGFAFSPVVLVIMASCTQGG